MVNIIVAFPKLENGKNIKNILVRNGFQVGAVCSTGAQILQQADLLEDGIVICAARLKDMMYLQLRECLPPHFQMLVAVNPNTWGEGAPENVVCLAMPFKVHELVSTLEMMYGVVIRRKKKKKSRLTKRSEEETQTIQKAKEVLMVRNRMTEEEAHRYMQKCSMDNGTSLVETAQMILSMMQG